MTPLTQEERNEEVRREIQWELMKLLEAVKALNTCCWAISVIVLLQVVLVLIRNNQ